MDDIALDDADENDDTWQYEEYVCIAVYYTGGLGGWVGGRQAARANFPHLSSCSDRSTLIFESISSFFSAS